MLSFDSLTVLFLLLLGLFTLFKGMVPNKLGEAVKPNKSRQIFMNRQGKDKMVQVVVILHTWKSMLLGHQKCGITSRILRNTLYFWRIRHAAVGIFKSPSKIVENTGMDLTLRSR